ncbi:MAG TPA: AAA family ATPase [Ktedonobacterales bacterium]
MWGKRRADASAVAQGVAPIEPSRTLTSLDDLLRRAEWDRLSESDRESLRAPYPMFPDAGGKDHDIAVQDWIANLVAPTFQVEAAQVIQAWLTDASPHAHLYIGGAGGQGRVSLVASLARKALAERNAPPDYVYAPEPSALDQARILALPGGTGKDFAGALDRALRFITSNWDTAPDDPPASNGASPAEAAASSDGAPAQPTAPGAHGLAEPTPEQRLALVDVAFSALDDSAFDTVRDWITELRGAFAALARDGAQLSVGYDDLPTWLVRGGVSAGHAGAPVVIGTLLRDKLDDLLMRANGGVLVLPAADLLAVDGAWLSLNAALGGRRLQIKAGWPALPLSARIALIGDGSAYNALASAAGDFTRLFRYEAWLNPAVSWSRQAEAAYAALADGSARSHDLPPFSLSAIARLIEEGARRGDGLNRSYLSADLVLLRDLASEAGGVAKRRGATATEGDDLLTALQRRRTLQVSNARRVREAILSGQANTPTAGVAIGQVNGLGIYEFHPSEGNFAVPTRISATVSPERGERLLDIEREAEQADADHVRGAMTIEGYLAHRYGQTRPLNLVGRIRFEQEHGTTGGDSASGAILFSLLSALAQAPIAFARAVTGAVGQYGEMQPIGGVNTKIEGFWELCRQRRARGEQVEGGWGVLIPAINARDLMLRDEVAEAIIHEGWFHIWLINTVDDALPILMGLSAQEIHARVEQRLQRFHAAGTPRT